MLQSQMFVVDCEYNSMNGELLSMAIVPLWPNHEEQMMGGVKTDGMLESKREFYEVLEHEHMEIHPWVAEHVIPVMNKAPVSMAVFQERLEMFLQQYKARHMFFDWPDDIAYFSRALITGPGTRIKVPGPIKMEFQPNMDALSEVPHNALHDARGLAWKLRKDLTLRARRAMAH